MTAGVNATIDLFSGDEPPKSVAVTCPPLAEATTYRCEDCGDYWHQLIEVCLRNGDIETRCGDCLKTALASGKWEQETLTGLYMEKS